nr:hypothetical protein [Candidatus Paceibacterota bacterium]
MNSHLPKEVTYKCENCQRRPADRLNETVRSRKTKIARILNICNYCFRNITGAKSYGTQPHK